MARASKRELIRRRNEKKLGKPYKYESQDEGSECHDPQHRDDCRCGADPDAYEEF